MRTSMANTAAVNFLREHKARYPLEILQRQLRAQGYPEAVVAESVKVAYGGAKPGTPQGNYSGGFFNIRRPLVYATGGLKIWDFIAGLMLGGAMSFIQLVGQEIFFYDFELYGVLTLLAVRVVLLVFLFRTRRWMMFGLLAASVLAFSSLVRPIFQLLAFGYYY